ncbi:FecCD family ABC transporter permease [Spirillospora sp. NPDC127200]
MSAEPRVVGDAPDGLGADRTTASLLHPSARSRPAAESADPVAVPRRSGLSLAALFLLGLVVLAASATVSARIGVSDLGYGEIGRTLGVRLGLPVEPLPGLVDSLVWDLRLPRVLLAAVVGAMLAVCGTVLQAVTRNALADPYLLGVSSGASTGAVLLVVLGIGGAQVGITGAAFAGGLASFGMLMLLLRRDGLDSARIVLTGVIVAQLFSAVTSMVLMSSADAETNRAITHWLLGSMASARWDTVVICALATAVGLAVMWSFSVALDAMSFGADTAASLGVDVRTARLVLLVVTALVTSAAVASVGAIGFVGLIVPHGVRFVVGPLHRVLLPFAALTGAVFLVWTDVLARIVFSPQEIPVGAVTALLGVPLFLLVLRRRGEL